ncbi:hypothetical protein ACSBR2_020854 [Camellia fascicularis]
MKIKERNQGIKKKFSYGRLKVTRHCLPDLSDISSPSDLLLRLSVSRHQTEARSVKPSLCFIKPTSVPHFEVPNPSSQGCFGVF